MGNGARQASEPNLDFSVNCFDPGVGHLPTHFIWSINHQPLIKFRNGERSSSSVDAGCKPRGTIRACKLKQKIVSE